MVIWWMIEGAYWLVALWLFKDSKEAIVNASNTMFWLPLEAMSNLIKEPGSKLGVVKSFANQMGGFTKSYEVEVTTILIVLVWTFIFIYLSYALLKKRDL